MNPRFNSDLPSAPVDQIMLANARWQTFKNEHESPINTTVGVLFEPGTDYLWRPKAVTTALTASQETIDTDHVYGYQTLNGNAHFLQQAKQFVFGEGIAQYDDIAGYQALGGTGSLRMASDTLRHVMAPNKWSGIPLFIDAGWPNYNAIFDHPFEKAQSVHTHPTSGEYWHEDTLKTLRRHAPAALVLQVCGYNDDGADRTQEQWEDIIDYATKNQTAVVLDSAYLGLANGPQQDRYPIERFVSSGLLTFICFSASKNLGLYNERVGALFVANAKKQLGAELAGNLDGVIKRIIRSSVSNAPLHAASAAASALANPSYYEELDSVRTELNSNRDRLHAILKDRFPHIGAGRGLFTKLFKDGFTPAQQQTLEAEGILTLPNSRINIGGMTPAQTVRFGEAVMQLI